MQAMKVIAWMIWKWRYSWSIDQLYATRLAHAIQFPIIMIVRCKLKPDTGYAIVMMIPIHQDNGIPEPVFSIEDWKPWIEIRCHVPFPLILWKWMWLVTICRFAVSSHRVADEPSLLLHTPIQCRFAFRQRTIPLVTLYLSVGSGWFWHARTLDGSMAIWTISTRVRARNRRAQKQRYGILGNQIRLSW